MSEQSSNIVSKVWGLCNPLRDDGVSYGDYLEQLTYLIFLKMSDEYSRPPYKRETGIPKGYTWSDMNTLKGAELENQYRAILERLGDEGGILGQIFKGAVNKISNVSILYRVVQMIDKENWVSMSSDVKGEIYEGLLQKNAEDVKSGAGQYFTPRPLIKAMVACLRPEPKKTIADPCCGSGGFFLAAQAFLADPKNYALDRTEKEFLKNETFYGTELVVATFKLCLMNLYLHNIGDLYGKVPVMRGDALLSDPGYRVDYVLTNPPFGKKSSITFTNEEEEQEEEDLVYNRQDFWTTSSNKQLNFIQHINTILKPTGKAAVVVPDNVLFEGGAGEIIRKKLLDTTDLHTILRLPTGIFYKPGVKANVIFFDKRPASPERQTKEVWIYDFRTKAQFKQDTIGKLIDIQSRMTEGKGIGYKRWLTKHNLKVMAQTVKLLQEKGLTDEDALNRRIGELETKYHGALAVVKDLEGRMKANKELRYHVAAYTSTKTIAQQLKTAKRPAAFEEQHRAELTAYRAAAAYFKASNVTKLPSPKKLEAEYAQLASEKAKFYEQYKEAKEELLKLKTAKQNVASFFREEEPAQQER